MMPSRKLFSFRDTVEPSVTLVTPEPLFRNGVNAAPTP